MPPRGHCVQLPVGYDDDARHLAIYAGCEEFNGSLFREPTTGRFLEHVTRPLMHAVVLLKFDDNDVCCGWVAVILNDLSDHCLMDNGCGCYVCDAACDERDDDCGK